MLVDASLNSTMISRISLMAGYLLARTASAGQALTDTILVRTEDVLSTPYASLVSLESMTSKSILRRQQQAQANNNISTSTADGIQLQPDGSLNLTAWDVDTNRACVDTLRAIQRSSNPSGNCICYNLPSLDATSGVFEAELRLYKVSAPRGIFLGVRPEDIKVSVSYTGASASPVTADTVKGAGMTGNGSSLARRDDSTPELLQAYMLVGQIDKSEMAENMSMSALQSLVMPTLTLSATNSSGGQISTNVSLNEATFLNGVFSREVVMSDFSAAQAAVDDALAALANGTAAFVLPGVQIMIFPVGLVITSVWLAIGLAAYGWGTYERIQYAEMYKLRKGGASMGRGVKTF